MRAAWQYRSIGFSPAAAGWCCYFLRGDDLFLDSVPLAGWVIQEHAPVSLDGSVEFTDGEYLRAADRDRIVVPAYWDGDLGMVVFGDSEDDWVLLGPGEVIADFDEHGARERRQRERDRRVAK